MFFEFGFCPEAADKLDPRFQSLFQDDGNDVETLLNVIQPKKFFVNACGTRDLPLFSQIDCRQRAAEVT